MRSPIGDPPAPQTLLEPSAAPTGVTANWSFASRFLLLNVGLLAYGLGLAAMIQAQVGLAPWDAFHLGLAAHVSWLTVGQASIAVGVLLQTIAAAFLGMPIGIGSVLNALLLGLYIDLFRPHLPTPPGILAPWLLYLGGIFLVGVGTGTYIASRFGAGPRDSTALGLARRTGWPIRRVRTAIELIALSGGFLLGAKIGWGTLAYALLSGPAMSAGLRLYGIRK
ncbi:MAG: YitT family protein [Cytophagales bacterium]|nr:YitT family protein [Armatimonadota bacterium]